MLILNQYRNTRVSKSIFCLEATARVKQFSIEEAIKSCHEPLNRRGMVRVSRLTNVSNCKESVYTVSESLCCQMGLCPPPSTTLHLLLGDQNKMTFVCGMTFEHII